MDNVDMKVMLAIVASKVFAGVETEVAEDRDEVIESLNRLFPVIGHYEIRDHEYVLGPDWEFLIVKP